VRLIPPNGYYRKKKKIPGAHITLRLGTTDSGTHPFTLKSLEVVVASTWPRIHHSFQIVRHISRQFSDFSIYTKANNRYHPFLVIEATYDGSNKIKCWFCASRPGLQEWMDRKSLKGHLRSATHKRCVALEEWARNETRKLAEARIVKMIEEEEERRFWEGL
jgi:hypothetical protein